MEETYCDCDRCGDIVDLMKDPGIGLRNGYLCKRCLKVRAFDDDNPILYPFRI